MSKTKEFFATSKYDLIKYNSVTGLYDISLSNSVIASGFRIFNSTNLVSDNTNNGLFYISSDNKYIYLDGDDLNLNIKYLYYSINNLSVTNTVLSDIYLGSSVAKINDKTYNQIKNEIQSETLSEIQKTLCINFAYEQNLDTRTKQINLLQSNPIYQSYLKYTCNQVNNITIPPIISGTPGLSFGTPGLSSGNLPHLGSSGSTSDSINASPITNSINIGGSTLSCNSNNMDIKEYNVYYMYGLTFLNGMLIIIGVSLIFLLFDDKQKSKINF